MNRLRVAIVYASDYRDLSPGGIRKHIEVLSKHASTDLELTFIGISSNGEPQNVYYHHFIGLNVKPIINRLNLGFLIRLLRFDFSQFDIVLCHRAETALLIAIVHRKKILLTLHGGTLNAFRGSHKLFGLIYPILELLAVGVSKQTLAVNLNIINFLVKKIRSIKQAPIVAPLDTFSPSSQSGDEIFLVGRLENEKRFDVAIEVLASAQLKLDSRLKINIVGDGSCRSSLQNLAAKCNLDVKFHGQLSSEELADLYRQHGRILLMTSKFEGAPIVAFEAILSGMKVIALANPGIGDFLAQYDVDVVNSFDDTVKSVVKYSREKVDNVEVRIRLENEIRRAILDYWEEVKILVSQN